MHASQAPTRAKLLRFALAKLARYPGSDMEWLDLAIGISVFVAMMAVSVSFMLRHRKSVQQTMEATENERLKQWQATVTGSEIKHISTGGAHADVPIGGKVPMLVVYYRRDDGLEGHVMRYEDEAMNWAYTGALAFYRDAPPYAELATWSPGDRLVKPAGQHFPHKVRFDGGGDR